MQSELDYVEPTTPVAASSAAIKRESRNSSLTEFCAYRPAPDITIVAVPLLVLSVTVNVAERDPVAPGVDVTVIRQVPSGLIVPDAGQVVAGVIVKSEAFAPPIAMPLTIKAMVVLVSVSVEVLAALVVPTRVTPPKLIEAGSKVAMAKLPAPVPLSATVCDPALVLSETVRVAERAPAAVGLKVTVTRQVPSGFTVPELGQVLDALSLKSPALVPVMVTLLTFSAIVVLVSVKVDD